jgi:hypothetical protein
MTDIFFAEPRHHYQSYEDLRALIRLSEFETCFIDEIDPDSDNAYVITILNGEVPTEGYPNARAKIVLWDLEYHLDGVHVPGVKVWAADKWYSEQIGGKYVPMGSHPGLCPEVTPKQDLYDVAFIGYFDGVPRRQLIRHQLMERGVKVSPPGAWGAERHTLLRNSAAYLCVHQHEHIPTIAPLRMVVAAAYGLAVISETVADAGIFNGLVRECGYDEIANVTKSLTAHFEYMSMNYGEGLHQALCRDLTFRKSVESAL